MADLNTSVLVYDDADTAEADWQALEAAAQSGQVKIADAALVENQEGAAVILQRQSHHGWGKGAVVGAVVGILFPPSLIGAAAVGAGGGAIIAGLGRKLGRGKVKDLGDTLDKGKLAIIVVYPTESADAVTSTLKGAKAGSTAPSSTEEELQQAMNEPGTAAAPS